jgi:hypothetical protein
MMTFSVKNYERFQHYKDRNPPWIKLYNELLDDYEFGCLQDASKLHLILIWLLASRSENKLPYDSDWISRRINASEPVDLDGLVQRGFLLLDQPLHNAEQLASTPLASCLPRDRVRDRERDREDGAPDGARPGDLKFGKAEPTPDAHARAPSDAKKELYRRGEEVLGKNQGGLVTKLLKAKGDKIPIARAALEQAAETHKPRDYIGAIVREPPTDDVWRPVKGAIL